MGICNRLSCAVWFHTCFEHLSVSNMYAHQPLTMATCSLPLCIRLCHPFLQQSHGILPIVPLLSQRLLFQSLLLLSCFSPLSSDPSLLHILSPRSTYIPSILSSTHPSLLLLLLALHSWLSATLHDPSIGGDSCRIQITWHISTVTTTGSTQTRRQLYQDYTQGLCKEYIRTYKASCSLTLFLIFCSVLSTSILVPCVADSSTSYFTNSNSHLKAGNGTSGHMHCSATKAWKNGYTPPWSATEWKTPKLEYYMLVFRVLFDSVPTLCHSSNTLVS